MRRCLLITNPAAAGSAGRLTPDSLAQRLKAVGWRATVAITERPDHAMELARTADKEFSAVIAAGGDGTVNEVANGLLARADDPLPLGVIPIGTGNDVAQTIGAGTLEQALEVLQQGRTLDIDVIEVTAGADQQVRHALLFAAVGFAGEVTRWTTPRVKRWFGPKYCYSVGFFRALGRFTSPHMRVQVEERVFEGAKFLVCAGNTETAGGGVMRLSPGASFTDGLINLSIIEAFSRFGILQNFPKLLRGTHIEHPAVTYFTGKEISMEAQPAMPIQIDGELWGETPARFRVRPRALKVFVAASLALS
jgi:YegS/Rv2252/BmrU family lipid kinase